MSLSPAFDDFAAHYDAGKSQLLWRSLSADMETPVSAYLKLCGNDPYGLLLESVEGGETLGRYSVIGTQADQAWRYQNRQISTKDLTANTDWSAQATDTPLTHLREQLSACHIDIIDPSLPPMAASGLFGYLGYDMVRLVEDIPDNNPDDLGVPDAVMMRPRVLLIFDNVKSVMHLVTTIYAGENESAQAAYTAASARLEDASAKLDAPREPNLSNQKSALTAPLDITSNTTREEYGVIVEKAVEHIHAGEIFQVVPSQRFSADFDLPSFALYRALRRLNPSPFLFHIAFDGFSLVGSSPEILVRVRQGKVTIRPIAGTRKRGKDAAEDKALAADLLSDPKERSEHLMLLDLGRNDVGRVAKTGTVNVTDQFTIEHYSHVMHIVSNVEGELRDDVDIIDALFAGFPAGTVSGAPKVRAMEIIDELENSRRGTYGGAAGYFSGNGEMDSCITLRTALVKDGKVYVQAGGGVVADSTADFEYEETINKSRALIRAAELAIADSQ